MSENKHVHTYTLTVNGDQMEIPFPGGKALDFEKQPFDAFTRLVVGGLTKWQQGERLEVMLTMKCSQSHRGGRNGVSIPAGSEDVAEMIAARSKKDVAVGLLGVLLKEVLEEYVMAGLLALLPEEVYSLMLSMGAGVKVVAIMGDD